MALDTQVLKKQSQQLGEKLAQLEAHAFELAGETFNLNSTKQLQSLLFEKLQLPILKKTPKGQPSTNESVLQKLAEKGYELPQIIIQYRQLAKLKNTYLDTLPKFIDTQTGRIHTSYHQAVTATGRLSSSDPNLQNIPIRTQEGSQIRQAFVAAEGYEILSIDYSQIELRIMAHLSEDAGLIEAFNQDLDIHKATASEIFNQPLEQITPQQRRAAKAVNFGLIYGMSAYGLAQQLGISRKEAQEYIERYFHRYPGVKNYMDKTRAQAKEQGYVETLKGRRLYLPDINAKNQQVRQYAERTAINAPMQGTAADIIKLAMIQVHQWIQSTQPPVRMVMQVHDELVFEVAQDWHHEDEIITIMCSVMELKVPLKAEAGRGANWLSAH